MSGVLDSFWHEMLPLLTPSFVARFNEGYETILRDESGQELCVLPVAAGVERRDIVAEFAFRLGRITHNRMITIDGLKKEKGLIADAEKEAFELIRRYEGGQPGAVVPLSEIERSEGLLLCGRYQALYSVFPKSSLVEFCPTFPGAGFLDSCEGDIAIGDSLIEVKTTTRKPAGKDLRQLIVYLALDANAGRNRWSHMALFNPRRGTLHRAEVDSFVLRLSGGKPRSDVFADLIAFVESNEPVIDRTF
jgi:hypothetical protein